jgi:hypothetical protein
MNTKPLTGLPRTGWYLLTTPISRASKPLVRGMRASSTAPRTRYPQDFRPLVQYGPDGSGRSKLTKLTLGRACPADCFGYAGDARNLGCGSFPSESGLTASTGGAGFSTTHRFGRRIDLIDFEAGAREMYEIYGIYGADVRSMFEPGSCLIVLRNCQ